MATTNRIAVDPSPSSSASGKDAALFRNDTSKCSKNAPNQGDSAGNSAAAAVQLVGKENEHERDASQSERTRKGPMPLPRKKLVATKKKQQLIQQKPVRTPIPPKRRNDRSRLPANPFMIACDDSSDPFPSYSAAAGTDDRSVNFVSKTPSKGGDTSGEIQVSDTSVGSTNHLHHLGHPGGMIRSVGPVRVRTPHRKVIKRNKTPSSHRVGVDGTGRTPSKELLRSTACSRAQKLALKHERQEERHDAKSHGKVRATDGNVRKRNNADTTCMSHPVPHVTFRGQMVPLDQSFDVQEDELADDISALTIHIDDQKNTVGGTSNNDESIDSSIIRAIGTASIAGEGGGSTRREFIDNPVAITLLNKGEEDLRHLLASRMPPPATDDSRDETALPAWYKPLSPIFPGRGVAAHDSVDLRTPSPASNAHAATAATNAFRTSPVQRVPEVSGNLSDVKDAKEVATLLRPIAVLARTSRVHPLM